MYLFALQDDLVIDAKDHGNELRFVNSNMNISLDPNVASRFCYIDGYPRIFFICIKDIKIGEELLIDYGDEYNKIFLS
jgi:SET domain-containing protein